MATTDRVGDLFRFESKALPESTRVAAFRGREGLSELYRFEIGLLVPVGADIDLDAVMGERALSRPSRRWPLNLHSCEVTVRPATS